MPKRKPKPEKPPEPPVDSEFKVALLAANGALRKLGERDLLLETAAARVLRFRLLAKTQFRNLQNEPIRDSLLQPGDRLIVQVNAVDEETALRVILERQGSPEERTAAARPVDTAAIRPPSAADFGGDGAPDAPAAASELTPDQQVIQDARDAAQSFLNGIPDYIAEQVTTRYQGTGLPGAWQAIDAVTAEVAYAGGKEEHRNVKVNGLPPRQPIERSGMWTTGDFVSTLQDVMSPASAAVFKKRGKERVANREAVVFDLAVAQENSNWRLVADDGRQFHPAYTGRIWVDEETRKVLRLEQKAATIPPDFPYDRAESRIEYGFVVIDNSKHLLPVQADNIGCRRNTAACSRNTIVFRNYRKFSAESKIKF
jgi:hypothetical protein